MKQGNLIPRAPRRMKQPSKNEIRRRLEVAQAKAALDSTPRWWQLWHRIWARVVEVDALGQMDQMDQMQKKLGVPGITASESLPGIEHE